MTFRILHLSDTHVSASGLDSDGVDAIAALEQMLQDCARLSDVDLIVVTGDVSDDGSSVGCSEVRKRVGVFAAERSAPHMYTTGNHDRRDGFSRALGTGHLDAQGGDRGRLLSFGGDVAAVSNVGDVRIVTLDSLIPGEVHGEISTTQLDALANELRQPAAAGTVLAFHHPPVAAASAPWTRQIGLRNAADLAAVVADSDVRAILCGHFHLQLVAPFAGTTVWVTPGVVSRFDLTASPDRVRAVHGASATVVDLDDDGGPPTCYLLHARDRAQGKQIVVVESETWRLSSEDSGPQRP